MNPSTGNQFTQALAQLTGGGQQTPTPVVPQSTQGGLTGQQSQFDPQTLFNNLIHTSIVNGGYSSKHNPTTGGEINLGQQSQVHGVQSHAVTQAIQNGADPSLLDQASQYLNKNQFIGLCEAFVEKMTKGVEGIYKDASTAWNQQASKVTGLTGVKPGDAVYFAPDASNGYNGHTGVYEGNNQFVSATYNGVKQYDLNDWQKMTGQKLLGYVPSNSRTVQPKQVQQPLPRPAVGQPMTPQMAPRNPLQKPVRTNV